MVSTHSKNISQIGNLPQVGMKIKNIWNHHLVTTLSHIVLMWKRVGIVIKFISPDHDTTRSRNLVCLAGIPWVFPGHPRSMKHDFFAQEYEESFWNHGLYTKKLQPLPSLLSRWTGCFTRGRQTHWNVHHIIIYGWNWSLLKWRTNSYSTQGFRHLECRI